MLVYCILSPIQPVILLRVLTFRRVIPHHEGVAVARFSYQQYELMVEAYRKAPGNAAAAARAAGIKDYRTAMRAWRGGYSGPKWFRAIEEVLAEEKWEIRQRAMQLEAQQASEAAAARDGHAKARKDAVEEHAREAQAARAAMSTGLGVLAVAGSLSKSIVKVAKRAGEIIDDQASTMSAGDALAILSEYSKLAAQTSLIVKRAMEITRMHLGRPGDHAKTGNPTVDADRAVEMLGNEEAIERAASDLFEGRMTPEAMLLLESMRFGEQASN